jgi:hypothetical protein
MWILIGLGMWLAALGALMGTLAVSGRESRREEAQGGRRHLSLVRPRRSRSALRSAPEQPAEPEGQPETQQQQ